MNLDQIDSTAFSFPQNAKLAGWLTERGFLDRETTSPLAVKRAAAAAVKRGELTDETFLALTAQEQQSMSNSTSQKAASIFGGNGNVRVKDPSERFSTKRWSAKHKKTGLPVIGPDGDEVTLPSELDKARVGVLIKSLARKSVGGIVLEGYEQALLDELCSKSTWCGTLGGEHFSEIQDAGSGQIKALLDDSTSGGLEIAPIEVDRDIVTFPLLSGELFPHVTLSEVTRGRRIEGSSIATPTIQSGGADDSNIDLFTTTSMIAPIDTTIHVADAAIEVGRDFMSDAIVDIGSLFMGLYGERMAAWLDEQIAVGDGSTEPEGLTVASGFASVTPDNTTSGPPTLEDYYDLMFGIGKQYRTPAMAPCFVSNDTTYARSRGIRVDPHNAATTVDQRPVFGIEAVNSYRTLDWPHRVQNSIPNGTCIFGPLKKYRMYRRSGLALQVEAGGQTLVRKNLVMIVARARFGGAVMDSGAFAKWTNGQS